MSEEPGTSPDETPPPSAVRRPWWTLPHTWLGIAVATYFVVAFALSWERAIELQTTTWDMGIYQQALWSTAHGRMFYEAADFETGGYRSLLQVHTVFLFYLLAPLYAAFPYQATLLAVQALVVAAGAVPLYLLGKDLTRSSRLGLVVAVAFLVWTPVLSANLYDFHAEAFLPVEIFTLVLFWERERYLAGALVAAIAFATLELAPVLVFFLALYFLLPSRSAWERWSGPISGRGRFAGWGANIRAAFSSPRVRASTGLLAASVAVYLLLVYYRVDYLQATLGTAPLPFAPTGYVIGSTPSALGLSLQNISVGFYSKVTYWLLLLSLLAFVPLLAPRALVLSLPWFGFTMLSSNLNYVELGFQYGFIAAASLLVAFAYGLPRAVVLLKAWSDGLPAQSPAAGSSAFRSGGGVPRWRALAVAGFVLLVGVNLALSPLNPQMQNMGLGAAYRVSYDPAPGYADVEQLAALDPAGASLVASDNLFPLVANDENAYSFLWAQDNFLALPFNATHLPAYVFLASNRTAAVPAWLAGELYDPSAFGVRAVAWSTEAGPVLLFERGFGGVPQVFGSPSTLPLVEEGASLVDREAGYTVAGEPGGGGADLAASVPGVLGTFFFGPWANLPGGNYTVTLWVNVSAVPGEPSPAASEPVLWIGASAFAQSPYYGWSMEWDNFPGPILTAVSFNISLPGPTIQFALQGVALATNVQAFLQSVEIMPA